MNSKRLQFLLFIITWIYLVVLPMADKANADTHQPLISDTAQSTGNLVDLIYYINDEVFYLDMLSLESFPLSFPQSEVAISPNPANILIFDRRSGCMFNSTLVIEWCFPAYLSILSGILDWEADGQTFWIDSLDGLLHVNAETGAILQTLTMEDFGLDFSGSYSVSVFDVVHGSELAVISTELGNDLFIVNLNTLSLVKTMQVPYYDPDGPLNADFFNPSFSPNGQYIAYFVDCFGLDFCDSEFVILNLQTNQETHIPAIFPDGELSLRSEIAWSTDSQRFAAVTTAGSSEFSNKTYIYDLSTQSLQLLSQGYSQAGTQALLWSPNGDLAQSICQVPGYPCELSLFMANGQRINLVEFSDNITDAGILAWIPRGSIEVPNLCTHSPLTSPDLLTALNSANANPDPDTICLDTTVSYSVACQTGEGNLPVITSPITLQGNGATITCSVGGPTLLQVAASGSLTLQNVTVVAASTPTATPTATPTETPTHTATATPTFTNTATRTPINAD